MSLSLGQADVLVISTSRRAKLYSVLCVRSGTKHRIRTVYTTTRKTPQHHPHLCGLKAADPRYPKASLLEGP